MKPPSGLIRRTIFRLRTLFLKEKLDAEMSEELRAHLEMQAAANRAAGMPPDEAHYAAQRQFGGVDQIKETARDQRGWLWLEQTLKDVRYALRQLAKYPGFTAVSVLTLALGIASTTVMFAILKKLVLEPLPYPQPDRVVQLWTTDLDSTAEMPFSVPDYFDFHEQNQSFAEVGSYSAGRFTLGGDAPESVGGVECTASLWRVLGIQPALGRWFNEAEEEQGAHRVVVLTNALWQRRFGADPGVIGQTIRLNGQQFTVLGVMPAGATLYSSWTREGTFELFRPLVLNRERSSRGGHGLATIGRLKPGVTLEAAQTEARTLGARLARAYPESNARLTFQLVPLAQQVFGHLTRSLVILQAAVFVVLLLACANVAGMLLARTARRQTEIAVRTALGATRLHVFRAMLAESLVLSLIAGAAGWLISGWTLAAFAAIAPNEALMRGRIGLDPSVLVFSLGLVFLTALLAGLPPTLIAARTDVLSTLKEGGPQQTGSRARLRQRRWLVVAQVAFTLLLVNTGLLLSASYCHLVADSRPFVTDRVLSAQLNFVGSPYRQAEGRTAFADRLVETIRALPSVQAVGITSKVPFEGFRSGTVLIDDELFDPQVSRPAAEVSTVSAGYFAAAGLPVLRGRLFDEHDAHSASQGVIVNRTFAERFWPAGDPIGKRVRGNSAQPWFDAQIVGVVDDVRQWGAAAPPRPEIYFSNAVEGMQSGDFVVVRTTGDAHALAPALREQLRHLDSNLAFARLRTFGDIFTESTQLRRLQMQLIDGFMVMALLLAAIGIYGTLAFYVETRTREIGVRMALGATARDIGRLVFSQAARWLLSGTMVGLVITLGVSIGLRGLFYQTSPLHPLGLIASVIIVASAAAFSCWLPARRAARVDPMIALRAE
jgi:predicted permease